MYLKLKKEIGMTKLVMRDGKWMRNQKQVLVRPGTYRAKRVYPFGEDRESWIIIDFDDKGPWIGIREGFTARLENTIEIKEGKGQSRPP